MYYIHVQVNFILKIKNNINSNIKSFWKYIKSLRSHKINIPATVYFDNIVSDNINDTTKLFADYFPFVFVDYSKNTDVL